MLLRPSIVCVFVSLAACGSPSPQPQVIAATPSEVPPAAWDPAALPRTVAVSNADGTLTLARVTTDGVTAGATVASVGPDRGWLDDHTLVGLTASDGGGFVVARLIDGTRADDLIVTPTDWPGVDAELVLGDGEIWLAGCKQKIEFTDCHQPTHLRVQPGPRLMSDHAPAGRRYGYHGPHLLPAPSGAAPAGTTARVDVVSREGRIDPAATTIHCAAPDGDTRITLADLFDDPLQLSVFGFGEPAVRWLATTPPLFEVSYASTDPIEITRQVREVFRPCTRRPVDDFRWLGDGVWAQARGTDDDVQWTFHHGDRLIGELPGRGLD